MSRKKTEVIDDEGNVMPMPGTDAGDVAKIIYLMEYARLRGFQLGPTLKVGEIVTVVRDLRQAQQMAAVQQESRAPDISPGSDMGILLGVGEGDE